MTLKEAYQYGEGTLLASGVEEAHLDAWLLLEHVTGISRALYYISEEKLLSKEEELLYKNAIKRRSEHIPLQHITGSQEFMGLSFMVNEHVLIPRQDTELLVEEALNILKNNKKQECHVLDMCTGSGCILLSIMHHIKKHSGEFVKGVGVDVSPDALDLAKKNGDALNIPAVFCQSDLFDGVEGRFEMIVSNPPYIPTKEIEHLQIEVKDYDPMLALDGKEDGLFFYKHIIKEAASHLHRGGFLLFEIGYDQGDAVSNLMMEAGYSDICVKKDLSGLDRVVIGVYDR